MDTLRNLQLPHPSHRPTAEQFRLKKPVTNELDCEIQSIESEIERLRSRVQCLRDKKKNLVSYFSPLRCLPNDLLREIIEQCLQKGVKLANLMRVCGAFRDVVIGLPSIWSKIRLQVHRSRIDKYQVRNSFDWFVDTDSAAGFHPLYNYQVSRNRPLSSWFNATGSLRRRRWSKDDKTSIYARPSNSKSIRP
jgi:hypothetical protein